MTNISQIEQQLLTEYLALVAQVTKVRAALDALGVDVQQPQAISLVAASEFPSIGDKLKGREPVQKPAKKQKNRSTVGKAAGRRTSKKDQLLAAKKQNGVLPDTGGTWMESLLTKENMFRNEIMASAIAKAAQEMKRELTAFERKKLGDRVSEWTNRNSKSGVLISTGKKGDTRYTLARKE